jgi:hypothetical protein
MKQIFFISLVFTLNHYIYNQQIKIDNINSVNKDKIVINFNYEDIPIEWLEELEKRNPLWDLKEKQNMCLHMLIIRHLIENINSFPYIKPIYEKYQKPNETYYNYYLLLHIYINYKSNLPDNLKENQINFRMYELAAKEKFIFSCIILRNVEEKLMTEIHKLITKQQNKNFIGNIQFQKECTNLLESHKKKDLKDLKLKEILLHGQSINFVDFPKEILEQKRFLQRYFWCFLSVNNSNDVLIVKDVNFVQIKSYEAFIKKENHKRFLEFYLRIIFSGIYTINNQNPIDILDMTILDKFFII